ncbi:hypothetical protein BJ170DRAFT_225545 [Xylariales sp. AK1849]|nr:hypothetical protein BJ170DRAFT_225545 [Xylariales sp. AK1849]
MRKRLTAFYASQTRECDPSNVSHAYFTSILENVRKVLEPAFDKAARSLGKASEDDDAVVHMSNRFELLELLDISLKSAESSSVPQACAKKNNAKVSESSVQWEVESTFEGIMFRFRTLLHDLQGLRTVVIGAWGGYAEHRHLEAVAFPDFDKDLQRCREPDGPSSKYKKALVKDLERAQEERDEKITSALVDTILDIRNIYSNFYAPLVESLKVREDEANPGIIYEFCEIIITTRYDEADHMMCGVFNLLSSFQMEYSISVFRGEADDYLEHLESHGDYRPARDRSTMSGCLKWKGYKIVFHGILSEVCHFVSFISSWPKTLPVHFPCWIRSHADFKQYWTEMACSSG